MPGAVIGSIRFDGDITTLGTPVGVRVHISALAGTVWPALVGVAEVHPPKNVLPDARQSVVRNDDSDQVAVSLRISVAAGHKATEVLAVVAAAVRHFLDAQATGTTYQIVVKVVRFL